MSLPLFSWLKEEKNPWQHPSGNVTTKDSLIAKKNIDVVFKYCDNLGWEVFNDSLPNVSKREGYILCVLYSPFLLHFISV